MTRHDMLNEHLEIIHVVEALNFSNIKSKSKAIGGAAATGNILKMNQVFDTIPDIPLNSLNATFRKKFPSEYKSSDLEVSKKVKKEGQIKEILTLSLASLRVIKKQSKDPGIIEKINKSIEQFGVILRKVANTSGSVGVSFITIAVIIQFFTTAATYIAPLLAIGGVAFIAAASFIYLAGMTIGLYIQAKKLGKRTIE